jgi:hypothetical protein
MKHQANLISTRKDKKVYAFFDWKSGRLIGQFRGKEAGKKIITAPEMEGQTAIIENAKRFSNPHTRKIRWVMALLLEDGSYFPLYYIKLQDEIL